MKTLTNLTIAALALITLNGPASAKHIHTLDEIHDAENNARKAAFIQRRLAINDPKVLAQMKEELNGDEENKENFQGEGHRLGGDKYVNRLLGIDHKQGKKLFHWAKQQAHEQRKAMEK